MPYPYERDISDIIYHGAKATWRQGVEWPWPSVTRGTRLARLPHQGGL